uniref:Uncharacterized protein n=1 Tax=Anguilla anguilla TaxID=7936 RepID=A0A0E9TPX3_ANGAN
MQVHFYIFLNTGTAPHIS